MLPQCTSASLGLHFSSCSIERMLSLHCFTLFAVFPVCFTLAATMDVRWQWHCVCGLGEQPKEVGYHVLYQPQVSAYQSHQHASMDAVLEYHTDVL